MPLLRGGHHPAGACAHPQPAALAQGCSSNSTSPSGTGAGAVCKGFSKPAHTWTTGCSSALWHSAGSGRVDDLHSHPRDIPTPETVSVREATCAHARVVAGTATVGFSEEQRCKRPPPRATISASPSDSEGSSKPGGPCLPNGSGLWSQAGTGQQPPCQEQMGRWAEPRRTVPGAASGPSWLGFKALIYVTILKQK